MPENPLIPPIALQTFLIDFDVSWCLTEILKSTRRSQDLPHQALYLKNANGESDYIFNDLRE